MPVNRTKAEHQNRAAAFWPYTSTRQRNAAKRLATESVERALRNGSLKRQCCAMCGALMSEAHHDSYRKPLHVIWLCRHHHRERDAMLRSNGAEALPALPVQIGVLGPVRRYKRKASPEVSRTVVTAVTQAFIEAMHRQGINEAQLGRLLGVCRQQVNANIAGGFRTLATLATWVDVIECTLSITIQPKTPAVADRTGVLVRAPLTLRLSCQ